jgi:hypothetical protein
MRPLDCRRNRKYDLCLASWTLAHTITGLIDENDQELFMLYTYGVQSAFFCSQPRLLKRTDYDEDFLLDGADLRVGEHAGNAECRSLGRPCFCA